MKNNVLKILLWGDEVGKIYWDESKLAAVFNYNPDFVKKNLDIAPFTISIHSQYGKGHSYRATSLNSDGYYKGLPPFLADSLPEKWGTTIFNCWARTKGLDSSNLTPVDRLAFIGKRAMGAFEFMPDTYPWNRDADIDLSKLYDLFKRIYEQREETLLLPDEENLMAGLCEIGTSAGGQHSKAVIAINSKTGVIRSGQIPLSSDYNYYLLKFAEGVDFPTANIEMAYYYMAKEAGINMMPSVLYNIDGKEHFLTQRYDRLNGEKIFTQTLSAVMPGVESYEELFHVCDKLKINVQEKEEMFRRTVFNLFSGNTDDHNRNFSFLMTKNGIWHITPAYDLTFTADMTDANYGNYHSLSLNNKYNGFTIEDLKTFAGRQGIRNANKNIECVLSSIANFHCHAKKAGLNTFATNKIEKFLSTLVPVEYANKMTHYIGTKMQPYFTESGFKVHYFRLTETMSRDFELLAEIDGRRYRTTIDGESEEGTLILSKGGNNMGCEDIKSLIEKYLIPKAEIFRDRQLYLKIKEVSIFNDKTKIRCKTDNGWMPSKKIKVEDKYYEDEYDLAFKYYKEDLLDEEIQLSRKGRRL